MVNANIKMHSQMMLINLNGKSWEGGCEELPSLPEKYRSIKKLFYQDVSSGRNII